jgi:hypothetical protein
LKKLKRRKLRGPRVGVNAEFENVIPEKKSAEKNQNGRYGNQNPYVLFGRKKFQYPRQD